ncbi:MAG: HAMP domain-containing protein, partial [Propionibacteriaceae bacterium]|nr:HAMP domain-containing protein [Propionibacteriaceae bacterium]
MKGLGLRWRIALALVAVVVAACAALTLTTTQWATDQFTAQLEQMARTAVGPNAEEVAAAALAHPAAVTVDELKLDTLSDVSSLDAPMQGFIIPLEPLSAGVQQRLAHQFSFLSGSDLLAEAPQCLASQQVSGYAAGDWEPGSSGTWSETCGDYVLGFGLVAGGGGSGADSWLVVRALHRGDVLDPVPDLRTTLLLFSSLIVVASVLVAAGLAAMVARPLTRTRQMAEAVAAGDLDVRIPVRGRDEVARLGTAVNTMADRLTAQITDLERVNELQRRFVSDVAHDLR